MRPTSIVNFERLYLGAVLIGIVNTVLNWNRNLALVEAQPGIHLGAGFLYFTTAVGIVVPLLLWYFIARRASVVAKWILVALFVIGLLGIIASIGRNPLFSGLPAVLGVVTILMQAAAVWMLFRPDASAWLSSGGSDAAV